MEFFWLIILAAIGWLAWSARQTGQGRDVTDHEDPVSRPYANGDVNSRPHAERPSRHTLRRFNAPPSPLRLDSAFGAGQPIAQVASESRPGAFWTADLAARTCSCPDFAKRRAHLETSDARRLCKHQVRAAEDRGLLPPIPEPGRTVLRDQWFTSYDVIHVTQFSGIDVVLAFREDDLWINLFAPTRTSDGALDRGRYMRFGYHLQERRWARGDAPRWVRGASASIRQLFS